MVAETQHFNWHTVVVCHFYFSAFVEAILTRECVSVCIVIVQRRRQHVCKTGECKLALSV